MLSLLPVYLSLLLNNLLYLFLFSAKVASISQTGSLSLFSSKEQELEQRALLLKRLAFVIFCSDVDQNDKSQRLSRSGRCSSSCSLLENKLKDPVCEIEATLAENTKRYELNWTKK